MTSLNYRHVLGIELFVTGPWATEWDIPHEELVKALEVKLNKLRNTTPLELRSELFCGEIAPYEE